MHSIGWPMHSIGLGGGRLGLVDPGLGDAGLDGVLGLADRGRPGLLGVLALAGGGDAGLDLGVGGNRRAVLVELVGGVLQVLAGQGGLGLAGAGAAAA
jgi:hypothetical protein